MIPLRRLAAAANPRLTPDEFGFLIALDKDLRSRQLTGGIPHEVAGQATTEINDIPAPAEIGPHDYFTKVAEVLQRHSIVPFKDRAIAFVGCHMPDSKKTYVLDRIAPSLWQAATIYDIAPNAPAHAEGTLGYLNTQNAFTHTGGKQVDYVITGNVVNAPIDGILEAERRGISISPPSLLRACATLLKQGGFAIHLCGYGGDGMAMNLLHDKQEFARLGQGNLQAPGEYYAVAPDTNLEAVVLQQLSPLQPSPNPEITDSRFISTGAVTPLPAKGEPGRGGA